MKHSLPALVYQKIGNFPAHSRLKNQWTTPPQLDHTLAFLVKHKYHFITPKELQLPLPPSPILLVFLGGYQSFYTEVFPLLQKYNIRATCAVAVDTLGTYNSWQDPHQEPWQNILTGTQLKEIYKSERVQIATLGLDGHNLLTDTPAIMQAQLTESIYRLKNLYNIDASAIAFWPLTGKCPTQIEGIDLPILSTQPTANKQPTRLIFPHWLTWLRLYLQK